MFTFYGVAEAGAHLTSSNASSIGGESMKEAFSAESIKHQLDPMTLISNFKDINIGHALQEGSKEGLKELTEHAKDVAIHHTLMDGLDTFSEANEEAINETVSNLFFSNNATETAQLSTGE
ncbi:MAG: hypothetical protein VXX85_00245 [Candidatus Margulisiibacteriota bacterium]|nr:hypothetical protein [Candidatus Margulisiibacteriota bacterium]